MVDLMEVMVNFGGGREVVVVSFDEIGSGGCLVEVEGGGGVKRGCGGMVGRRLWGGAAVVVLVEAAVELKKR